jgi:hypothetical protein
MKGKSIMKNQNTICIAVVLALAFALAPVTWAQPSPQGGPAVEAAATHQPSLEGSCPEGVNCEQLPVISIHSTGNVLRAKTGSFVLEMKPALMFGAMFVNFKVSGTAVAGVDYIPLLSPAYIGQSGYGTILVHTLADPRGSANLQAYSLVVTLEPGAGYALGSVTTGQTSATIWIKP